MFRVKAVALDFDGVILESAVIKIRAFEGVFADHPEHLDEIIQHHLNNVGVSRYEKFKYVYANILKTQLTSEEMNLLAIRFSELSLEKVKYCKEVSGALSFLKESLGKCLLFVVSGTPQRELEEVIEFRGLSNYFTRIFGSPPAKKMIFSQILEDWNLEPADTVFVGDSMTDFRQAYSLGIPFIGRLGPEGENFQGINVPTITDMSQLNCLLDLISDKNEG